MKIKYKNFLEQIKKFKLRDITVFHLIYLFFFFFAVFAVTDIVKKRNEMKKYDLEMMLTHLQIDYPDARISFQNISIDDEKVKIKNNKLFRERDYYWIFAFYMPIFFLNIFSGVDIQFLKVKHLEKVVGGVSLIFMLGSFLFFFFTFMSNSNVEERDVTEKYLKNNTLYEYKK